MRYFLIAIQFLTIFPIKLNKVKEKDFGNSLRYFPLVGTIIGLIISFSLYGLSLIFPYTIACLLILIILVVITGAIHLDGFADTCDGLCGSRERHKILEIMRDSHIGVFGTIGLILLLGLKFSLFHSMPQLLLGKTLVIMTTLGRWLQVLACYLSSYAQSQGKGKYFVENVEKKELIFGGLFSLAVAIFVMGVKGIALFIVAGVLMFTVISYIKRRVGGMTGDTIGAVNEVSEAIILLISLTFGIFGK